MKVFNFLSKNLWIETNIVELVNQTPSFKFLQITAKHKRKIIDSTAIYLILFCLLFKVPTIYLRMKYNTRSNQSPIWGCFIRIGSQSIFGFLDIFLNTYVQDQAELYMRSLHATNLLTLVGYIGCNTFEFLHCWTFDRNRVRTNIVLADFSANIQIRFHKTTYLSGNIGHIGKMVFSVSPFISIEDTWLISQSEEVYNLNRDIHL
jgi:hypothetical protein